MVSTSKKVGICGTLVQLCICCLAIGNTSHCRMSYECVHGKEWVSIWEIVTCSVARSCWTGMSAVTMCSLLGQWLGLASLCKHFIPIIYTMYYDTGV